jgi:N-acetylglucosaminyl-diphospho-decaprenol L-rhamnosyltransferase
VSTDVEVLIVSYASASPIRRSLESVRRLIPGAAVAIREHSDDVAAVAAIEQLVAEHPGPIRLELDPSNPGFGAGCNGLASSSPATWLLLLNPDAELLSWPWRDATAAPPLATIVGPEVEGGGGAGAHYGTRYRVVDEIARSWLRRPGRRPTGRGFVSGAAMLIDAASFRAVGGFDPGFFLFYEDIDLCLRANRHGLATVVDQRWRVAHVGGHSTRSRFGQSLAWSYESACKFHAAQGSSLVMYRTYVAVDSAARALAHALLRHPDQRRGYARLAIRAFGDLFSKSPGRDR